MRAGVRVGDPTGHLFPFDPVYSIGKRARRVVAGLNFHARKVERAAVDPRRGAGF